MSKRILYKELIHLNVEENSAKFFHIELLSVGYNQMQLITTSGSFNNKGREHIVRFDGKEAFQQGRTLFYQKFLEKKAEGFVERQDVSKWVGAFRENYFEEHLTVLSEHRSAMKKQHIADKKAQPKAKKEKCACSLCQKPIPEKLYSKINEWARGEGNWDGSSDFVGFEKVLCIPCQMKHDIFKKKVEKNA